MSVAAQFPNERSEDGAVGRQDDAFRNWVRADEAAPFPAAAGRYHLYVSLACPWAHRTIVVRRLYGLEDAISLPVVDPVRDNAGWAFRSGRGFGPDPLNGFASLGEAYRATSKSTALPIPSTSIVSSGTTTTRTTTSTRRASCRSDRCRISSRRTDASVSRNA